VRACVCNLVLAGCSWLIYDAEASHAFLQELPNPMMAKQILDELRQTNPLLQSLRALGELPDGDVGLRVRGYTHISELAIVRARPYHTPESTVLYVWKHGRDQTTKIAVESSLYEPLSLPLIHTRGEPGWSVGLRASGGPTIMQYTRARILVPENLWATSRTGQLLQVNRLQLMARLMQLFVLEQFSRYIDMQLTFFKKNQHLFHRAVRVESTGEDDVDNSRRASEDEFYNCLPTSFIWGYKYKKARAANALHLVSRLGPPTLFITLTTNPEWPELNRELLQPGRHVHCDDDGHRSPHGQYACDRPDLTCRIFYCKLAAMLCSLRAGEFLPHGHQIVYEVTVVEFQKRGLPHAHIVLKLSNMPPSLEQIREWVNNFICSTAPNMSDDEEYKRMVSQFMTHECGLQYVSIVTVAVQPVSTFTTDGGTVIMMLWQVHARWRALL